MARSYVENLISFISNMRIGENEGGEQPTLELFPFKDRETGAKYSLEEIVFNTSITPDIKKFTLQSEEGGIKYAMLCEALMESEHYNASWEFIVYDVSNCEFPENPEQGIPAISFPDNSFFIGLGGNGMYPFYFSNQEILDYFKLSEFPTIEGLKVGWNGNGDNLLGVVELYHYDNLLKPHKEGGLNEFELTTDANEPLWNGVLIGSLEEGGDDSSDSGEDSSDDSSGDEPEPLVLQPYEYGDRFTMPVSRMKVDTSKGDELGTYISGLNYSGFGYNTMIMCDYQGQSIRGMLAKQVEGEGYFIVFGNRVLYSTYTGDFNSYIDGKEYKVSFVEGWNNIYDNEFEPDLEFFGKDYLTVTSANDTTPPTWNGVILGK